MRAKLMKSWQNTGEKTPKWSAGQRNLGIIEVVTSASIIRPQSVVNRPNAVAVGTIVWLASEVMFFAGLFAIYFSLRSMAPEIWAVQTAKLNIPFSALNTTVLVLSSVTCQMGVFAAERLQPRRTGWAPSKWGVVEWFWLTYAMGAFFVVGQVYEYAMLTSEWVMLNSDAYGSGFYLTTGFHGLHVTVGLIAFLLMIGRIQALKVFTHRDAMSMVAVSYYWHFVDAVWIGLFLVIYVLK
jgi:cytochrome c oxidase subunit 3